MHRNAGGRSNDTPQKAPAVQKPPIRDEPEMMAGSLLTGIHSVLLEPRGRVSRWEERQSIVLGHQTPAEVFPGRRRRCVTRRSPVQG